MPYFVFSKVRIFKLAVLQEKAPTLFLYPLKCDFISGASHVYSLLINSFPGIFVNKI